MKVHQKALNQQHQFAYPNPKPFRVLPSYDDVSRGSHQEPTSPPSTMHICENVHLLVTIFFAQQLKEVTGESSHFFLLARACLSMMPCCQPVQGLFVFANIRHLFWLVFCQCALCIKGATCSLKIKSQLVLESRVGIEVSLKLMLMKGIFFVPNLMCFFVMELKPQSTFVLHCNV